MESSFIGRAIEEVRRLLATGDTPGAARSVEALLPPDQADVFAALGTKEQDALLVQLGPEDNADLLEELENEEAALVASRLPINALAPIVDEMEPDEAADLLGDLDPSRADAVLHRMSRPDDVWPLLSHPDDTAGGLMTSEYLAFPQHLTAGEIPEAVRTWFPRVKETPYIFVIDDGGRLAGVVNIFEILRADVSRSVGELMDPEALFVNVRAKPEDAAHLAARYDLVAIPVVDDNQRLVGVIKVEDLVHVLVDEATEDVQRFGGSAPLHHRYFGIDIPAAAAKRLGWLLLLFVTGTLTGTVMRLFEALLSRAIVLTFFVPLLIGTGGNAGSQTTATVVRALAVGELGGEDALRVLWREFRTGLVLGLMLAVVGFVAALLGNTGIPIALVISASMLAIVIWADCVGALLPLLALKLGRDPALVSGPLMSTLVDATGLLIYFAIAQAVLAV